SPAGPVASAPRSGRRRAAGAAQVPGPKRADELMDSAKTGVSTDHTWVAGEDRGDGLPEIETDGSSPRRGRRRRRLAAVAAILLAVGAAIAAVALSSGAATHASPGTGVPTGETTAEVTRRTLTESSTVDGTLTYGGSSELYDRLSSAGTFTWLP